jgi:Ca-activated chloride channel homolog
MVALRVARKRSLGARRGSALIVVAAVLMVACAIASYAINVVYMEYTRAELQISTDLATRAACRALVDSGKRSEAYVAAQRLTAANKVAGQVVEVGFGDLDFTAAERFSTGEAYVYSRDQQPNAVHFRAGYFERTAQSIPMLFPSFGVPTYFRPLKEASAAQADLDLAIVLDCSESMLAPLDRTTSGEGLLRLPTLIPINARWRTAEAGIAAMLSEFRDSPLEERVAMTTFNTVSLLNVPLTVSYLEIEAATALQQQVYLGGLTSLSDGIQSAIIQLSNARSARPWASRVILLLSDGKENFGLDSMIAAQAAANAQMMVYAIGISNEAEMERLNRLAKVGHGKAYFASSSEQFREIIKDIAKRLPVLLTR